jgi:integrase/recombinase XerD
MEKISAKKMARKVSSLLKTQSPNYDYLRDVFRFVRENLNIEVTTTPTRLPYVPTEDEIRLFYKTVWESNDIILMLIVKVLLYTGVRGSELINIQICDIDLTNCRIKINQGKGKKDRVVPFSPAFKETLALHLKQYKNENRMFLFESAFRRHYTDRGIRKIHEIYQACRY